MEGDITANKYTWSLYGMTDIYKGRMASVQLEVADI